MYQQYSGMLLGTLNSDVNTAMAAALPPLSAALVVWIIVLGYLMMSGRVDMNYGLTKVVAITIVVGLVSTSSLYREYVQNLFMVDIPSWVANIFSSGKAHSIPALLDIMYNEFVTAGEQIYKKISFWGPATALSTDLEITACEIAFFLALAVVFGVYLIATMLMGLLVVIGPFILVGFLFDYTKGIVDHWIAKLVGLSILLLMTTVVLSLFIGGGIEFFNTKMGTSFEVLPLHAELITFGEFTAYAAVMAFITIILPGLAAYLGGGVDFDISGLVRMDRWFR